MPTYCHRCEKCGATCERIAPMRAAGNLPECKSCQIPMVRDYAAEQPRGNSFEPFEACSGGAAAWEMKDAFKKGNDWFRRRADGTLAQLNPPGFKLNPKNGDVIIQNRSERLRYMREMGYGECRE